MPTFVDEIESRGFAVVAGLFSSSEARQILAEVEAALQQDETGAVLRSQDGHIFGARNVIQIWPAAATFWKGTFAEQVLHEVLGPCFGLVRVLYFDKHPEASWALGWHKDRTIAVRDNRIRSDHFTKPTTKAGTPHVEAPVAVLERMLTLRLHLDDVTEDNGPLQVIPGSHKSGIDRELPNQDAVTVFARAGDGLFMRPLISHASDKSSEGTHRHRRVLHLEFAADRELFDGYAWQDFIAAGD